MGNNIYEVLMPLVVIGTFSTGVVLLTQTLTEYYLRKRLIDKGLVNEDASNLLKKNEGNSQGSLKWGLIILFGGIGLILISALDLNPESVLPFGVFAVSLSLGFLVYFFVSNKFRKE